MTHLYSKYILLLIATLFGFATCCAENYEPVAVYLTWQRSPESTMTINWITFDNRADDQVEFRDNETKPWDRKQGMHSTMPGDSHYLIHSVELTNLQPATDYAFRTGHDAVSYKFRTMPATLKEPIRFVVGGDMYHDGVECLSETNRQAAKTDPMFALVGGDIAYAADTNISFLPRWTHSWIDILAGQKPDRWLAWLIAWKNDMVTPDGRLVPILPVLGNHDTSGRFGQTPDKAPFFYALFPMPGPQGYNVLDFGNYMSIVLLDSGHTHPIEGTQAQWLTATLDARQQVPHKFAIYHVPAYPSVRKPNDEMCAKVRKNWVPIFEKFNLTAAFENHDHAYKRTHPIKDGKIDSQGIIYLGDGAWGVDKPRKARRLNQKWYLASFASERHFLMVTINEDKRHAVAITSQGKIIDETQW
jgi:acid phosphatase type 7